MESAIINEIIAALISAIAIYVGFINRMRTQISVLEEKVKRLEEKCDEVSKSMSAQEHSNTVLEEKVKRLESRQDSHAKKNDDVITLINEMKIEMVKKISDVSMKMGKISSDVENINATIAIFDSGIVSKKGKKKGVK
jgi:outer membrane murein-binding lipoprotein Lpp